MTLWEILKANKTGIAPDMFTMLAASKMNGGRGRLHELSGTPPLSFTAKGKPLTAWSITGNTVQNGTPTPENPVEVQAVGDRTGNLFDNSLLEQGGLKASAGTIPTKLLPGETNYTRRTRYNQIIPLLASTLSLYCPANIKINYVWIDANGISLGGSGYQKNGDTATAPEQAVSMTFILGLDSDIECTPSDFSDINLVAGSIAPESYEPYGYKIPVVTKSDGAEPITTPIYLPTPLYSGEVLRSDGSREVKWGKLVLTGEETWKLQSVNDYGIYNFYTEFPINDIFISGLCNNFKLQCSLISDTKDVGFLLSKQATSTILYIRADNTIATDVNAFKSWLAAQYAAGTPVAVWYRIATPTTETFTAPQIPTLNGTTVIDVDTAVKPESMTIKYRR